MRPFAFPAPPFQAGNDLKMDYVINALRQISDASHDQITDAIADAYTVTNLTETRSLDCNTATLDDLRNVVGTLLNDMQNRGVKRG